MTKFWTIEPNKQCISCYDSANVATGLWPQKGGGWSVCPDCGAGMCYGCVHAENLAPWKVDCRIHGDDHDATKVCDQYKRAK